MPQFDFEKFDKLAHIQFQVREIERGLGAAKEHLESKAEAGKAEAAVPGAGKERLLLLERFLEKVGLAVEEVEIIKELATFCGIMDADRVRTRQQVVRLLKENKWLRSELVDIQRRLRKLEDNVVVAEAEKQHYMFVFKMRNLRRTEEHPVTYMGGGDDEEETEPEEEVPAKIRAVANLCAEYIREKRYEVALPLLEGSITQIKAAQGESNNDVATLYSMMAKLHREQGNLASAQYNFERCLKIREKVLGKDHNGTGIALTNLAFVFFKVGNLKEAEKMASQALKIREKTIGKTHFEVALLHSQLGTYCLGLDKSADSVNHLKTAIGIYEQMFDCTDNLIIRAYETMAKAYVRLKQSDKAAETLQLLCRSFQQKNNLEASGTIFMAAQDSAEGKGREFTAESLMKAYGTYENVCDKDTVDTIVDFFVTQKKPLVADVLRAWIDASGKQPTPAVRQSVKSKSSKRASTKTLDRRSSQGSQSSKKDKKSVSDVTKGVKVKT